jgi:hypothetical protein
MSRQVLIGVRPVLVEPVLTARIRRVVPLLAVLCGLGLTASTASATTIRWSAARTVDTSLGQSLLHVQCPSVSECVAVDDNGRAINFDPAAGRSSLPVQVAAGQVPTALACPSATQCTTITTANQAYTFDPAAPQASSAFVLEPTSTSPNDEPPTTDGLACPSTSACVATDTQGNVITFDPGSTAAPELTSLGPEAWSAVACPSATQCTVAGDGVEATFDPSSPTGTVPVRVEPGTSQIIDLACSSRAQCTALDGAGGAVTFNPQAPPTAPPDRAAIGGGSADAIACGATTQCTIVAENGKEFTFDPATPTPPVQSVRIDPSGVGGGPGQAEGLTAVSCPATTSCVAVDAVGRVIEFAPASPGTPQPVRIDAGSPLLGVSCPSARQCTTMGPYDETTFDPFSAKAPTHGTIVTDHFFQASGVACATPTRCLSIITGHQATFDPERFKRPKLHQLASYTDAAISGIACPTATECVAVDTDGSGISYDPATATFIRRRFNVEEGEALTGAACSTKTQCTAVDNDGQEITFQPLTGRRITTTAIDASVGLDAPSGDSDDELDDVSCPSVRLCVAIDSRGAAVAFDPRSPHSVKPTLIDTGNVLTSISCPTTHRCVAVDGSGRALAGTTKPSTWSAVTLSGASALLAVDCPSDRECVAVDATGDAFTGRG